jgi:hypothetical protein
MITKTLFQTLELDTGTWTIEVVHGEATTHVRLPKVYVSANAMPVDPWADIAPLTIDRDGMPLYAPTMVMNR